MIDYDPHDWRSHLFDVRGSMLREIIGRVAACVAWAAVVVAFHRYVHALTMPTTVHTLVGIALGLLLVFRTNASYDRYWEGRKLWGSIINESRNLARAARALLADAPGLLDPLVRWTAAFSVATMNRLRGEGGADLGASARGLPPEEVAAARAARHAPLHVAGRITALLVEARDRGLISDIVLVELDRNVQLLVDYLGSCERIRKTPLPFAYVVHLRRALILYCFTLPLALVEPFGWHAVPSTLLVAYIFFGIEEIGVEIEDPFNRDANDLPLEAICATIEADLLALLDAAGRAAPAGEVAAS